MTEKKIKSPFKRHLSNEKLTDTNGQFDQADKKLKLEDGQSPKKRIRKDSSESSSTGSSFQPRECETDRAILDRRQKQIDYGKNTVGYDNYISAIQKWVKIGFKLGSFWRRALRSDRAPGHPKTPPKHLKYSRRAWEGLIKSWRRKLHTFDPSSARDESNEDLDWFSSTFSEFSFHFPSALNVPSDA